MTNGPYITWEIYRGDTIDEDFAINANITGYTNLTIGVKANLGTLDTVALLLVDTTTGLRSIAGAPATVAGNGVITVSQVSPLRFNLYVEAEEIAKLNSVSGEMYYDVQWVDAAGKVTTIRRQKAVIVDDVVRGVT